jgi:hypothetical protein
MGCLLAAALALALYLHYGARSAANVGFPLDDSWIHVQIARHVAAGQGWVYNPGEPTAASTSPLWVMAITPLFWLPGEPTLWIKALGSVLYLLTVYLTINLARAVLRDDRIALLAGWLTAWQPALIYSALSGMETPLFVVLTLLALRCAQRSETSARNAYLATAWLALAGWARPELWATLPLLWGYLWRRRRELPAVVWPWHLLLAAASVAGFVLFHLALWGHPLPSTFYAKPAAAYGATDSGWMRWLFTLADRFLRNVGEAITTQNPLLLVGLGLILARFEQRSAAPRAFLGLCLVLVAWVCLITAVTNLGSVGFQTFRRTAYVLPGLMIVIAAGVAALWDEITVARLPAPPSLQMTVATAALLGLALAWQANELRHTGALFANDLRSINQGDVAAAQWIAAHTPPGALVAANDIGALAYVGQRRIFDLIGLASPDVIPILAETGPLALARSQRLKEAMWAQGVEYVVIFPTWFPGLARDPDLVPLQRFVVERPTALAGDEVVVYRLSPRR